MFDQFGVRQDHLVTYYFQKKIYILAITETWLRPHDTAACIADISPSGYTFHHRPRSVGRGRGVGFLLLDHFKVNSCLIPDCSTFESIYVEISHSSFSAYFACLHQPPGQPANFFEEFQDLFENLLTLHSEFCIFGDLSLQLDKHMAATITFDDILNSFDLKQHVTFSTHIRGHWLDLVIVRSTCDNIQMLTVSGSLLDHHTAPITTKSASQKPPAPWMTLEILQSKRRCHYLERVWYKSRSHLDRSRYSKQCHYCNTEMAKAKSDYYTNMVSNNAGNPRQLLNCINKILHRVPAPSLPNRVSIKSLCDSFSSHFKNKISLIQSAFPDHTLNPVQVFQPLSKLHNSH